MTPPEPSLLLRRFFAVVRDRSSQLAMSDEHEQVTFAELGARVRRVAAALERRGLRGKRLALLLPQGSGWVEAFFGALASGATVVPLSHLHPEAEQRGFIAASRAEALISSRYFAQGEALADALPMHTLEELRLGSRGEPNGAATTEPFPPGNSLAIILYTSGTTGKPKGALIHHDHLGRLTELLSAAWEVNHTDTLLHCLPLHHLHGLGIALLTALTSGASIRMFERFDAARLFSAMERATLFMGVPTMHKLLLNALDDADEDTQATWRHNAAKLRLVTSGSAALPVSVGERWRQLTGSYPLERFGMTEIGVGLTNPLAGPRRPGSVGLPLPGMQIRVVNEHGEDAAPGEPGELWIAGPTVFAGYDGDPGATSASFEGAWFKSGDTAAWEAGGYCKILGRTSVDILKSGGYKLSALELEELLRTHPDIADAAVVGIPDETWGEIAVAGLLLVPHATLDEASLREWAKERVAAYKVPRRALSFDDFPRNPVGKVMKPTLKQWITERLAKPQNPPHLEGP
ncbi:MAG: AMP-binding protein [Polyangiaceae bacterium]|nr:AMP-binding protein [Polyangiaceae bacterium]MCW5792362.1 AMP-binding protein [Polyangiaceae bacterium]